MTDTILPNGIKDSGGDNYFKKGCNPFAQTGRSKLQNKRASLNQQIIKQMRMRAGAENLLKATSNNKVREMVVLELSYVNSNLQLLMEQLEGLNSSVEVYQSSQETATIPLIPLGLKETKEVDFSVAFKDFILEHYSEDGKNFDDEIADLMDLRQACRTPSRSEAGIELLAKYFNHLPLLESRFFSPTRQTGIFFTWYDSFTGVPVCQQNLSLEKASILFNMAALYTQIGSRSDRQTIAGLEEAISSFQKAAGLLNHLKETFTHTPSYDMSPAMLNMLIRMMLAQAQECLFEKTVLPGIRNNFYSLLKMAQEATKVSETYDQVHQSMIQAPIKDNVPLFWSTMSQIITNHYRSLAHYFVATALLDHQLNPSDDEDQQEKTLSQVYDRLPEGRSPLDILKRRDERRRIGKAHLRRAILAHEEALRICGLCRDLRRLEVLQEILQASHQRSVNKFADNDNEDEFTDYMEAPDIISKTEHKAEMEVPTLSKVKVIDFFQRLGPLSIFSAKQRWTAPRTIQLRPDDGDLGFTLKGEQPVQVVSLDPLCPAAADGLKEGDYIVAVGNTDCKWLGVSEVMRLLKDVDEDGISIKVVSMMDSNPSMPTKSATFCGNLPKTYSMICLAFDDDDKNPKSRKVTKKPSFLSWGLKNRLKSASTLSLPTADASSTLPWSKPCPTFPSSSSYNNDSALY
ncbi:rhophilin-2 isoform X2 [Myripristis murdjan]|uniref:Rhophilin, Rho GTPase binding protein 2 n=1 Tax=Myripristis murdjan TaxID=586833 RepID=A0A667YVK5_9TELE|nr:rhophilin-2 isoform X1 [Myripristis murdjan]XP_029900528.1 rhophilin-2 isoform X2 [Myripristis murdjan]